MHRLHVGGVRIFGFLLAATLALGLAVGGVSAIADTGAPSGWEIPSAPEKMVLSVADSQLASGATLSDFPVQVQLSAPDFDYSDASQNNLAFTTAGSSTPLPYEVENWNPSGTSTIWVQVPTLSASASELDLYFGTGTPANTTTASSVWDGNFMMVNHFDATSGTTEPDSTANDNNGTLGSGTATLDAAGQEGSPALQLGTSGGGPTWTTASAVGFSTAMGADSTGSNSFANGMTWTEDFYTPASDISPTESTYYIIGGRDRSGGEQPGEQFDLVLYQGNFFPRFVTYNSSSNTLSWIPADSGGPASGAEGLGAPATAGWHDLTLTYDDSTWIMYLDGQKVGSYADPGVIPSLADFEALGSSNQYYTTALQPFTLDGYSNSGGVGGFTYDDVQLSNTARSADWVEAQYLSQTNQLVTEQPYETQSGTGTGTTNTGTTTTTTTTTGSGTPPPGWQVPAAQERMQFAVDDPNITSTLQDFPVEVQLNTSDFDYADAAQDHLLFTMDGDASGTPLPYEVENWNPSGTSTIWVQVPTLTSTTQTLDLYYDGAPANTTSSTSVWDPSFMMVNHFTATSASNLLDSTATGPTGTTSGTLTFGSLGQTGTPAVAAGTGELNFGTSVGADNSGPNSFANGATFSVAFYVPSLDMTAACGSAVYCIIGGRDLSGGSEPGEQFSLVLTSGKFVPRVAVFEPGQPASSDFNESLNPNTSSNPIAAIPATAGWHDLTLTYDNSTVRFYLDGQLGGTYSDPGVLPSLADYQATTSSGSAKLTIAAGGALQPFILNGYAAAGGNGNFTFDDVQLSGVARSADWVNAQYLAQEGEIATPAPVSQDQSGGLQLSIGSPAANGSTSDSFTLSGYVSEQSDVGYTIDGGASVDAGQEDGSFSIPVTGISSGSHTLVVTATAADDTTSSKTIAFTAYTAGPAITFTSPTAGEKFGENSSFTVNVNTSDPAGVSSTTIKLDGQVVQNGQTISQSTLTPGTHTLSVTSTDAVGNISTRSITFTTTGDTLIADSTPVFQATDTPPGETDVLNALGAALPAGATGPLSVDLSGVNFDQPGQYPVTVTDSDSADDVPSASATIEVVPVSVVTLANPTVYFNTSTPPTSASIVKASGAEITDGSGNVVSGSVAASVPSGCGSTAGSCVVTLTGTDLYGFSTAPVSVTVDVSAASVSVANSTATFGEADSPQSQAAVISALGASVTGSTGGGAPAADTSAVDWGVPGTYTVTVSDNDANDAASTVTATVRIVPVPVVTLPSTTIYLPVSAADPLDAATLLANSGASLTDGEGNAVNGTLSADTSAVNGSVPGTYSATITGTDTYGFASAPVSLTVVIYLSPQQAGTVSITGTAAVGGTLTAVLSGWAPLADQSYQWLMNGLPIPGATSATYTVVEADAGQNISVEVVEAPQWYNVASATSAVVMIAADSGSNPGSGGSDGSNGSDGSGGSTTPTVTTPTVTTPSVTPPTVTEPPSGTIASTTPTPPSSTTTNAPASTPTPTKDVLKAGVSSTTIHESTSLKAGTTLTVQVKTSGAKKVKTAKVKVSKTSGHTGYSYKTGKLPAGTTTIRFYKTVGKRLVLVRTETVKVSKKK